MRQNGALYCWPLALVTIVGPVQTKSAQTLSAFARSPMSAHNPSFLHPEAEPKRAILSEGPSTDTESPQAPRFSTSSAQLFGLKDHESLRSSLSRRYGQRISISGAAWRHVVPRGRDARLRFLYVFIATSLAIYFTKYAVRCLVTQRQAGHITDKGLPGLEKRMSSAPCYASNYSVAGTVRRLAAGEENGGSRDSPDGVRPRGDSTDWFCQSSEETESGSFRTQTASSAWAVETSGGRKGDKLVQGGNVGAQTMNVSRFLEEHIPPGSRSAEAALLRHIADQVMGLAAASSAALSKTCHSTTCLRQALQLMSETYGMLLEEAGTLESPPRGSGDKTQSVDNPSDSGTPAAREKTSPLEHNSNSHSAERMSGSTSDAKSDEAQPVHAGRPVSLDMQLWRRLDFSLGTIFEAEDAEQDGGDDGDVGIERRSSFFTLSGRSGDDEDDPGALLADALSLAGIDEGVVGGWNPFSSTTSTSDAWGKFVTDQSDARETAGDDANDVTGGPPRRPSYSEVLQHPPARSHSAPPRSTAANGKGMAKRVAGLGQRLTSSGHRQSATSRDASGERRHYPSGPRVPGRRPTNRFESIDRSASHRKAGARPSLPSMPPPKPPLPQISKVGFGASGTPVQRGASQGGTPSGSEKRDGGEPSKDVKGQGEDAGQPGASGGPLGGAGGGGRRPGDDERDDDKRKKGKGSSSGGGEKKKEEQEKKAKKERDQREEAKKESKPVDDREARGKEVKQGGGGLSSLSGKGSTGEEAGKKKAKKDRGRRAIEETVRDVTDAGVTSEATGGVPKEAEPQKDSDDRGVHGGGRGGEGPGSAGATETGDALQHDSGGIGSGSEDRDKSRSETAAREKQVSKRQKSSGGRRKKKGASVAPQTGQTTTGEAPRSAVDSEGGRAGPLAASDKNKAGTDEGGRDAKGDEDGEAATAGPRAGAQHTGEHGGETEVVGETVKVAEADEEGSDAASQREGLRAGARPKTS